MTILLCNSENTYFTAGSECQMICRKYDGEDAANIYIYTCQVWRIWLRRNEDCFRHVGYIDNLISETVWRVGEEVRRDLDDDSIERNEWTTNGPLLWNVRAGSGIRRSDGEIRSHERESSCICALMSLTCVQWRKDDENNQDLISSKNEYWREVCTYDLYVWFDDF